MSLNISLCASETGFLRAGADNNKLGVFKSCVGLSHCFGNGNSHIAARKIVGSAGNALVPALEKQESKLERDKYTAHNKAEQHKPMRLACGKRAL